VTKNEFLRELENSLRGQLTEDDIIEIVSDYRDVFDSGKSEGKNENEISDEIGSPASIARTILNDISKDNDYPGRFKNTKSDTSNLTTMSKRLGAYIIDTFVTSLLLAIILFATFIPFYGISGMSSTSEASRIVDGKSAIQSVPANQYRERTTFDSSRNIKSIELFENNKRIFKGTAEEYSQALKDKGIDKNNITSFETVTKMPFKKTDLLAVFPMAFIMMFFGFSNVITAFELWIFRGYTIGKWMTRIKVECINGSRITFWEAFLRDALIKSIGNSITSGILNIASFIWGCATPEHKTIQDLAAKTRVINIER
jgi:uncharacterized RDD family membrane protein YckC